MEEREILFINFLRHYFLILNKTLMHFISCVIIMHSLKWMKCLELHDTVFNDHGREMFGFPKLSCGFRIRSDWLKKINNLKYLWFFQMTRDNLLRETFVCQCNGVTIAYHLIRWKLIKNNFNCLNQYKMSY